MLRKIQDGRIMQKNQKIFPLAPTAENRAYLTACVPLADITPEER